MLLVDAARHFRDFPRKNELRPQDVMRISFTTRLRRWCQSTQTVRNTAGEFAKQIDFREKMKLDG